MIAAPLALLVFFVPAAQQRCDLRVHVVEASTGKPLERLAVNLRLSERTTVQQDTDASGTTCFAIPKLIEGSAPVDAFSFRYLSTSADPFIQHLPDELTIRMRHLGLIESLKHTFFGG